MDVITLRGEPREGLGKGPTRRLRQAGSIPVVVYGNGLDVIHLSVDPSALELGFTRSGNPNTLVRIEAGSDSHLCMVKEVQRHPVTRALEHVDLLKLDSELTVRVEVPLRTTGRAEGEQEGGRLQVLRRTLPVSCRPEHIPAVVELDVTTLGIGKFFKASQVPLPEGVQHAFKFDFNVVTVIGKKAGRGRE